MGDTEEGDGGRDTIGKLFFSPADPTYLYMRSTFGPTATGTPDLPQNHTRNPRIDPKKNPRTNSRTHIQDGRCHISSDKLEGESISGLR